MSNVLLKIAIVFLMMSTLCHCESSALSLERAEDEAIPRVYFVEKSKDTEIPTTDECFKKVLDSFIQLLSSAIDKYKLFVSPNFVKNQMENQKGFKIVFSSAKKIKVKHFNRELSVKEIYIPVTGRFAKSHTTIFYADPEYSTTNQYINSTDKKSRQKLETCIPGVRHDLATP